MAKGKKQDISDIIRDAIISTRPKRRTKPYKFNIRAVPKPAVRRPRPPLDREKYQMPKRSPRKIKDDAIRTMPKRKPKPFGIPKKNRNY